MMTRDEDALAALRRDPALQRRAQTALEQAKHSWASGDAVMLRGDLKRYGAGGMWEPGSALGRCLVDAGQARDMVRALVGPMGTALREYPLGHIPLRHQYQDGIGILLLGQTGRATMSLLVYEDSPRPPIRSVSFSDTECREIVLAGAARGRMFAIGEAQAECAQINSATHRWSTGACVHYRGPDQAKIVDAVDGRMVVLRISRDAARPVPAREYRLSDGALLHRASGSRQESRQDMALALLHAMGRGDAAPVMAEMALEPDLAVRWQALRHGLALDTQAGFHALCHIADNRADPLAEQARDLKANLLAVYPQLSNLEEAACPA